MTIEVQGTDLDVCPVCWREVSVTGRNRIMVLHNDNGRNTCPMSGHAVPVCVIHGCLTPVAAWGGVCSDCVGVFGGK
jgi:hypothetical protein